MILTRNAHDSSILKEKKLFENMQDKLKMQNFELRNRKDYEKKLKPKIKPKKKKSKQLNWPKRERPKCSDTIQSKNCKLLAAASSWLSSSEFLTVKFFGACL